MAHGAGEVCPWGSVERPRVFVPVPPQHGSQVSGDNVWPQEGRKPELMSGMSVLNHDPLHPCSHLCGLGPLGTSGSSSPSPRAALGLVQQVCFCWGGCSGRLQPGPWSGSGVWPGGVGPRYDCLGPLWGLACESALIRPPCRSSRQPGPVDPGFALRRVPLRSVEAAVPWARSPGTGRMQGGRLSSVIFQKVLGPGSEVRPHTAVHTGPLAMSGLLIRSLPESPPSSEALASTRTWSAPRATCQLRGGHRRGRPVGGGRARHVLSA